MRTISEICHPHEFSEYSSLRAVKVATPCNSNSCEKDDTCLVILNFKVNILMKSVLCAIGSHLLRPQLRAVLLLAQTAVQAYLSLSPYDHGA